MILKAKRILSKNINRIKVPSEFIENPPKPEKIITKTANFFETGELEKIYIDENFYLLDGYCSYLIATTLGKVMTKKKVKIIMVRNIEKEGANNG
jgi:hypothetical protein